MLATEKFQHKKPFQNLHYALSTSKKNVTTTMRPAPNVPCYVSHAHARLSPSFDAIKIIQTRMMLLSCLDSKYYLISKHDNSICRISLQSSTKLMPFPRHRYSRGTQFELCQEQVVLVCLWDIREQTAERWKTFRLLLHRLSGIRDIPTTSNRLSVIE